MKKLLFTLVSCCALLASAQQVKVVEKSRLLNGVEGPAYFPVLNNSGNRLLFSGESARGLKIYDFDHRVVTRISDDYGAGVDATFGADGNVYYTVQTLGNENLIYRTGLCYDVAHDTSSVVLEAQHGAISRQVGTAGVALRGRKTFASARNLGTAVYTQGSQVFVTVAGKTRAFSPVESHAGYLWASLSPNADRVAFFAAGKGVVVIDLQGKVQAMLGNYEMPCWYNNDYIVAQDATDDGHQITSSHLVLLSADGRERHNLTEGTSMTMHPTSAAGKIVYTTIDGNLYLMKIAITPLKTVR